MVFRVLGLEGEYNGFNWVGEYSFGQEFQFDDDDVMKRMKVEKQICWLIDDFEWKEDGSFELIQYIFGKVD